MKAEDRSSQPAESWNLERWVKAAGLGVTGLDVMDKASHLVDGLQKKGLRVEEMPDRKTYYDWNANGIPKRSQALPFIAALGRVAEQNDIELLNNGSLHEHARIFLISAACRQPFSWLTEEERVHLAFGRKFAIENYVAEQARFVRPPAPPEGKLRGRALDLDRVLAALRESPICSIDSIAGNGKTALAWFAANRAVQRGLVTQFSWTTDKRVLINPKTAAVQVVAEQPLDFTRILHTMAVRFNWLDVASAPDDDLVELCRQRLQRGLYLIIIDNLETIDQHQEVVERLSVILQPQGDLSPQMSRALLTSREQVDLTGCVRVPIEGLDRTASHEMIRDLEPGLLGQRVDRLSDAQIDQLHHATHGNPLFLRIALAHYNLYSRRFEDILEYLRTGTNFNHAFDNLFRSLYAGLSDEARWLAELAVGYNEITYLNLSQAFFAAGGTREEFDLALGQLISLRIFDGYTTGETEYVFHPLIRAYICKQMDRDC
jgi:hypothetical protein